MSGGRAELDSFLGAKRPRGAPPAGSRCPGGAAYAAAAKIAGKEDAKEEEPPAKQFKSTRSDEKKKKIIEDAFKHTFGPLGLEECGAQRTKTRNHVNPLTSKWQQPVQPPDWGKVFEDAKKDLWVDIGCAQGRFGVQMALDGKWGKQNHLGLEIREPHVVRANQWAESKGLRNLYYVACNANTSLKGLLQTYPGKVSHVAVQFPDPQFKVKHHKRRVVTTEFVNMLAKVVPTDCIIYYQSDVEEALAQMRDRTDACRYFERVGSYSPRDELLNAESCRQGTDDSLWTNDGKRNKFRKDDATKPQDYGDCLLGPNPIGVVTEREVQNTALDMPIYRAMYKRTAEPFDESQADAAQVGPDAEQGGRSNDSDEDGNDA